MGVLEHYREFRLILNVSHGRAPPYSAAAIEFVGYIAHTLQTSRRIVEQIVNESFSTVSRSYVGITELPLDRYERIQYGFAANQSRQNAVGRIAVTEIKIENAAVNIFANNQELIAPIPVRPKQIVPYGYSRSVSAGSADQQIDSFRFGLGYVAKQIVRSVMFGKDMIVFAEQYFIVSRLLGCGYHFYEAFPDACGAVGIFHGVDETNFEFGFAVELLLHASSSVGAAFQIDYICR